MIRRGRGSSGPLEPIETILPACREDGPQSANGVWESGWKATRVTAASRRWAAGWDRAARCPPDSRDAGPADGATAGKGGALVFRDAALTVQGRAAAWSIRCREVGGVGGDTWRPLHAARVRVYRLLRRAGYVARGRWARVNVAAEGDKPKQVYTDGPAAGCRAVDPWELAASIGACAGSWYAQARVTAGGDARCIGLPRACGRAHVCPVCANRESATLAAGLRDLIAADGARFGALVTLTQRARRGRSLVQELDRLRAAMDRLWTGRARAEWIARIPNWYYGIEATRGRGGWWHVHAHIVIEYAGRAAGVAAWLGRRWEALTGAAASQVDAAGYGWDPAAGLVLERGRAVLPAVYRTGPRCELTRWSSRARPVAWIPADGRRWRAAYAHKPAAARPWGWWRPLDLSDAAAVYQSCKYPTPVTELDAVSLAEFVAVAHGRRWHDGGGAWRGARGRAAELAAAGDADIADDPSRYDIGRNVSRCGPKDAPNLDYVAPGIGYGETIPAIELLDGFAWWTVANGADRALLERAIAGAGGYVVEDLDRAGKPRIRAAMPRSMAGALVVEYCRAVRLARLKRSATAE